MTPECKHEDLIETMRRGLFGVDGRGGVVKSQTVANTKLNIICAGIGAIFVLLVSQFIEDRNNESKTENTPCKYSMVERITK